MPINQPAPARTVNTPVQYSNPQAVIILARLTATSAYKITCHYATEAHATYVRQEVYKEWRAMKRDGIEFEPPVLSQRGATLEFKHKERRDG